MVMVGKAVLNSCEIIFTTLLPHSQISQPIWNLHFEQAAVLENWSL